MFIISEIELSTLLTSPSNNLLSVISYCLKSLIFSYSGLLIVNVNYCEPPVMETPVISTGVVVPDFSQRPVNTLPHSLSCIKHVLLSVGSVFLEPKSRVYPSSPQDITTDPVILFVENLGTEGLNGALHC